MNLLFFLKPKNYVTYLTLDSTLRQGLEKMRNSGYAEIPVIDKDGLYAGTVRQGDFLWKILDGGYTDIRDAPYHCQPPHFAGTYRHHNGRPADKIYGSKFCACDRRP